MEYDVSPAVKAADHRMVISTLSYYPTCHSDTQTSTPAAAGCCSLLYRLLCSSIRRCKASNTDVSRPSGLVTAPPPTYSATLASMQSQRTLPIIRRRTPQEIYFESRGKSCKKLLKFNGSSNKILLYPEESWARTASSSYWTITPCWWHPNYCHIEEFTGNQRHATKAKMLTLEQKGSLLVSGYFRNKTNATQSGESVHTTSQDNANIDEFKLFLTSNISMEDYNMGYCLTGFVERRCSQTNSFQMTHFAVIKRQWPSIKKTSDSRTT